MSHHIGRSGIFFITVFVAWMVWVLISSATSQFPLGFSSPYIITPVVLILGAILGLHLRRSWRRGGLILVLVVVSVATAISIPIYANASAAVGGLLIALAGLAMLDLYEAMNARQISWEHNQSATDPYSVLPPAIVLALMVLAGIYLVLDSQAAIILTLPVVIIIVLAIWKRTGPPRWMSVVLGFCAAAMAGFVVIVLGNRDTWPSWLSASESFSSARHTLWSDALRLWAIEPLTGSGPGSFTPSSELASSVPSLSAAHSLVLQVGAELGAVGVVLLAALFLAGLLFAARGSRPVALIAITAWTALAVHSSIDHLEDFPIVGFMGGVILGWSGFNTHSSEDKERNDDFVGQK
ncbi:MAG: O-antigen ligase family protein [Yaniella sp.]|nr:O-antigen ligase family protein [Yaniella sp.]